MMLKQTLLLVVILMMVITACAPPVSEGPNLSTDAQVQPEASSNTEADVRLEELDPPTDEEILQAYGPDGPGWFLCPEETLELLEDGIRIACAEQPDLAAAFAPAIGAAMADGPEPGPADAAGLVYAAIIVATGAATQEVARVLMARNPALLPDVHVPEGVPMFPPHIRQHPRGAYTAKLKQLAWALVFAAWLEAQQHLGPPPDWCGYRPSDGAIVIVYYGLSILTKTGREYKGLAILVAEAASNTMSTAFTRIVEGVDGRPQSGNSSGNDFDQFEPRDCNDDIFKPPLQVSH